MEYQATKKIGGGNIKEEILRSNVKSKNGSDLTLQKSNIEGKFTTALAWEAIRLKGENVSLMKWIWNKLTPQKVSMCMWKSYFNYLLFDDRIKDCNNYMASTCNYCFKKKQETLDHVLSLSAMVSMVQIKAVAIMNVYNAMAKQWKLKIKQ